MRVKNYIIFFFTVLSGALAFATTSKEIESLLSQLDSAKGSCLSELPIARKIYQIDQENLKALKTIVECTRSDSEINRYASHMKEIFEESKILSIVPKLLDMAQVKDLVPILREVEVKENKTISDYLMINEIYENLGQPEKQIASLRDAMNAAPGDPRPILLLASKKFDESQQDKVEGMFRSYLSQAAPHPARVYLFAYVLAKLYPLAATISILLLVWLLSGVLAYRKIRAFNDWTEFRFGMPLFMMIVPPILAFRFWQTGKALPLGALLLIGVVQLFLLFDPWLSKIYRPVLRMFGKIIYFIFNGTLLAKKLATLSSGSRVLLSFTTLTVLATITPTIEHADIRYAVIIIGSLILYNTIGSLMISFMRSRENLKTTLRGVGVAATLPFLISYFASNWTTLGLPLMYGELPPAEALDSLASYMIFWGVSFFLAMHLGKIMAEAFTQPIHEIMDKVALIEKGNFNAEVKIFSIDEIGHLGRAINRLGQGLAKREKIEKTFSKYVDPQVAERILDGIETEVRVQGQRVHAVVMFCDIRGFTSLSEKSPPEEIVSFLNQFFERVVGIVKSHDGIIDKFIGDNMMAVWGVPKEVPGAEEKALRAALAMVESISEWNKELIASGKPTVGIGIGLNSGPVVAGSLGSSDRMEYTVIGDTVNTAQRAEAAATPQQIVVTEDFFSHVKDKVIAEALPPRMVKGKSEAQTWWSVTSINEEKKIAS